MKKTFNSKSTLSYGLHAIEALLQNKSKQIEVLYVARNKHDAKTQKIIQQSKQAKIQLKFVARKELDLLCPKVNHQGIAAQISGIDKSRSIHSPTKTTDNKSQPVAGETTTSLQTEQYLSNLLSKLENQNKAPLLVILDGVQDPHNLGAVLRSADAAGADAVIVPRDNAVGLTSAARKVACGAAETVPVIQVTNLSRTLQMLKEHNIWSYGLDMLAEQDIYQTDFSDQTGIALVFGAEGSGMRRLTRQHCDLLIKIPMHGTVESLNISVSAGITLFEVARQKCNEPS